MEWFCKGEHGIWAGYGGKQEMEELQPCPFCGASADRPFIEQDRREKEQEAVDNGACSADETSEKVQDGE